MSSRSVCGGRHDRDDQAPPGLTMRRRPGEHVAADRCRRPGRPGRRPSPSRPARRRRIRRRRSRARAGARSARPVPMTWAPAQRASGTPIDSDPAAGAVDDHRLAGLEMAVVEQRLPRREPGLRDRGGFDEVDRRRLRRQAARLDGHVLGGPAVAVAVDEAVDLVAHRHAGGAVAERDHDARSLVGRDPTGPRSCPARSVESGHISSVGVKLAARTCTSASPIAGWGSGASS